VLAVALATVLVSGSGCAMGAPQVTATGDEAIGRAFSEHRSDVQVTGTGTVTRVLSDDTEGGRHQRFVVALGSGQTLLIAHNIDIAPRIPNLQAGDTVEFSGVYEWNEQGGVVHWTHHDPSGEHPPGSLKHEGQLYQ
jgi:hypothetical protein